MEYVYIYIYISEIYTCNITSKELLNIIVFIKRVCLVMLEAIGGWDMYHSQTLAANEQ